MPVALIGSNQNAGTTVTIPTHQAGDLLLVFAYRTGTNAQAALPANWTNVHNTGLNSNSIRIGYRIAPSSGTASGTWTSANHLHVAVFRGQSTTNPIGALATVTGGTGTTITIPAITTLQRQDNASVVWSCYGHVSATTDFGAPTGMSLTSSLNSTNIRSRAALTNSTVDSFASRTVEAGSSSGWRAFSLEIRPEPPTTGIISATKGGGWVTTYDHVTPPHVANGDQMYLFASAVDFDSMTTPTGWDLLRRDQNGSGTATWIFSKEANNEPAIHTLTWSGQHWHRADMVAVRGAHYKNLKVTNMNMNDPHTGGAPQLTGLNMPTVDGYVGDMLLGWGYAWTSDTSKTLAIPNTLTTEIDNGGAVLGYQILSSSGTTTAHTFQCTTVQRMTTYAVLLGLTRPDSVGMLTNW